MSRCMDGNFRLAPHQLTTTSRLRKRQLNISAGIASRAVQQGCDSSSEAATITSALGRYSSYTAPSMVRTTQQGKASAAPLLGTALGEQGDLEDEAPRHAGSSEHVSARTRSAELAATFGGSDDEDDEDDHFMSSGMHRGQRLQQIGFSRAEGQVQASSVTSPPDYAVSPPHREEDVFFDAGDALASGDAGAPTVDPLGANRIHVDNALRRSPGFRHEAAANPDVHTTNARASGQPQSSSTYDFENTTYFTPPRPNIRSSRTASRAASPDRNLRRDIEAGSQDGDGMVAARDDSATPLARARLILGRFGRLVGMRVPGATYSSLTNEDDTLATSTRRRVFGSGIGQDGVFANLNAKPERRRRRGNGDEDRGEDDDLVDEVLPPAYEVAAADAAPPYWETTIIGGPGGMHPLASGGMGWTPGGAHVGALEDLIVDGLPVGNFFGFAWNLLVSMSFQFVGFLLTYLLHTTHAARCGSRAGLGITLVQYGFYLRSRAQQIADGKPLDDGMPAPPQTSPGTNGTAVPTLSTSWWGDLTRPQASQTATEAARGLAQRSINFVLRSAAESPTATTNTSSFADALAADNGVVGVPSNESMTASTEWLAYILMGLGWFILLTSLLSYWRVHRWGTQLVSAARRDAEGANVSSAGGAADGIDDANPSVPRAPTGFLYTMRQAILAGRRNADNASAVGDRRLGRPTNTGEDWIIYPGRPRRDLYASEDTATELPLPATSPHHSLGRGSRPSTGDDGLISYDRHRLLDELDH